MSGRTATTFDSDWIDLEFVQRERIPEEIIEVDIQLYLVEFRCA